MSKAISIRKRNTQSEQSFVAKLIALVAILIALQVSSRTSIADDAPNIVLIIADDMFADDFGFMGNPDVITPHIDRLAAKSARFVNGSVPTSVCSPSLATLLTGLYPHQSGLHFNHPPPGNTAFNQMTSVEEYERARSESFEIIRNLPTLPRILADELNYRSLQTGKFWEGKFSNAGFTEGMTIFKPVPGQEFGGNRTLKNKQLAAHGNGDWGLKIGRETMAPIETFLDDHPSSRKFIWYAPYLPHQPHDSPERFYDLYRKRDSVPEHRIPYYASITQFDETVGQLVEMIEARDLTEKTLFIFVIDNGWEASEERAKARPEEFEHTKTSKRSPFEPGLRTPVLFSWDGVTVAATHDQPVSSIDIVPTILSVLNLDGKHPQLPGINLWNAACGQSTLDADRVLFGEIYPGDAKTLGHPEDHIAYRWAKHRSMKLITVYEQDGSAPWGRYLTEDALYDLETDPDETTNVIDIPAYREQAAFLRTQLDEWWDGTTSELLFSPSPSSSVEK
ncbi:sulfatase-like hydrolase/transferase [Thalassoglobus sp. JC818]|uniref:sulfatase-like hydrolase/transferase n=1 Tax=Thalassoglobus sp. JC818 TaxID=3232136 RepID=UPI003457D100